MGEARWDVRRSGLWGREGGGGEDELTSRCLTADGEIDELRHALQREANDNAAADGDLQWLLCGRGKVESGSGREVWGEGRGHDRLAIWDSGRGINFIWKMNRSMLAAPAAWARVRAPPR